MNDDAVDVVIGLEIHVQLDTATKMFCGCSTDYEDSEPNTHTCPTCLGLPGALPVVNERAVEYAVKVGKALDCDVRDETTFHRKNYFYPDLPKDFQITQYDAPINEDGEVAVRVEDEEQTVGIRRAHMEEDPGALVHKGGSIERATHTLIDYNRSGTPLLEIVTEPDLRSPQEARALVDKLREILEYLGVFDVDRGGALRVDANVSIAPAGHDDPIEEAGNRTEVKNIGSIKAVEKALAYEVTRQKNQLKRGGEVAQETRHYDGDRGVTVTLREKVGEKDYRYHREADLPPLRVAHWADEIAIPELPDARRERFAEEYGLGDEEAEKLTSRKAVADLFEAVADRVDADLAATWIADELLRELHHRDLDVADAVGAHIHAEEGAEAADGAPGEAIPAADPEALVDLLALVASGDVTDRNAVEALRTALDEGREPAAVVEEEGLGAAGEDETMAAVTDAIDENPDAVDDYLGGDDEAINYLVGQVMQKTGGSADPGTANEALHERLEELRAEQ
jgi:aspartyl-tRNA(Asn)/glutamyl-tRNA(Gln) amidotransferase subunit B